MRTRFVLHDFKFCRNLLRIVDGLDIWSYGSAFNTPIPFINHFLAANVIGPQALTGLDPVATIYPLSLFAFPPPYSSLFTHTNNSMVHIATLSLFEILAHILERTSCMSHLSPSASCESHLDCSVGHVFIEANAVADSLAKLVFLDLWFESERSSFIPSSQRIELQHCKNYFIKFSAFVAIDCYTNGTGSGVANGQKGAYLTGCEKFELHKYSEAFGRMI
ncbi:hypothetical protein VNO77_29440 [Canavalia gladiata]|uniref:Uncharacterized protein n=1 Tax=Canavalia gladiata TaxID=3824 RepID=A0AAN9Q5C0_CANGL